jgi:YVTN family beta-propeller protein
MTITPLKLKSYPLAALLSLLIGFFLFDGVAGAATLYVSHYTADKVSVIDTVKGSVIREIKLDVGANPVGLALTRDNRHLYVCNRGLGRVSVIDTLTDKVVKEIPVGLGPYAVTLSPKEDIAYVTNTYSDDIYVIDMKTNAVIRTIKVEEKPAMAAFTPDGRFAYVTNYLAGSITYIDASTHLALSTLKSVGEHPFGIVAAPDNRFAYFANDHSRVSVIDMRNNRIVDHIPVGHAPIAVAVSPAGDIVYVNNRFGDTVSVIDSGTRKVVKEIKVGEESMRIALSGDGKYLYVVRGEWREGALVIVDTAANEVVKELELWGAPIWIAVDDR